MLQTRSHWLAALVLGATLATSAATATADTGTPPAGHAGRLQQTLGLTNDQMNSIRQLFAQHAADRKQLSHALRQSQSELRQLALTGNDPAAIQAKQAEVSQLLSQSVAMRVASLQAIAPILTPDQRAKLAQVGLGWPGHRGGHWHQQQGS
ncbi:MAG TPA: Spy/CpxP family protein refolding chaperone [Candidatus Methylomirabilis sp.]|nr:Spy/CpxP family protein refolding chaperone [Candidatus Methylomirabilis sp.]